MAGDIHLPFVGDVKAGYVYAGGAGLAAVIGIAYWRHRNAAQAATSTDTTAAPDPNAVDPSTGNTYAQEAAGNTGSFPYGGVSDYGGSYYGTGNITGYDQNGNPVYSSGITGNLQFTTNADWASEAESLLLSAGITEQASATAISRVLAGLSVTSAQQDIFMQAIGLIGQPPPNGYPKPIKVTDTPQQPPPTTSTKATVPNVVGMHYSNAYNELTALGLHVTPHPQHSEYTVKSQSISPGTQVAKGTTINIVATPTGH